MAQFHQPEEVQKAIQFCNEDESPEKTKVYDEQNEPHENLKVHDDQKNDFEGKTKQKFGWRWKQRRRRSIKNVQYPNLEEKEIKELKEREENRQVLRVKIKRLINTGYHTRSCDPSDGS